MNQFFCGVLLFLCSLPGYTWNAAGHQLIAQIAYDNLTPQAKRLSSTSFAVPNASLEYYFVINATWLDAIRHKNIHQFDKWHYIDIPFSKDKSTLPPVEPKNALWAIKQAQRVLSQNSSPQKSKSFFLKVLIHVVGDIHQPLHTATKISRRFPQGDLGGNLYTFSKTPKAKNMHQYWDSAAGTLKKESWIARKIHAFKLEAQWPCAKINQPYSIEHWLNDTHAVARTQAYSIRTHKRPDNQYQQKVITLSEQQIAFAGCRLAFLLNEIAAADS